MLFDRDLKIVEELVSKKKFEKAYIMIEDLFKIHPDNKQLREIRNKINTPVFNERLKTIQKLKKQYDFQTALEFAEYLHKEFPSYENLPDLEEIKVGLFCEEKYQEAMKYSKKKETRENAVTSLLSLLEKKSDYKDAAFQLHINIRRKKDEIEKKRGWIVSFILISIIMIIISINLVFIKNNNNSEYSFYTNTVIPDLLIMIINSIIFSLQTKYNWYKIYYIFLFFNKSMYFYFYLICYGVFTKIVWF